MRRLADLKFEQCNSLLEGRNKHISRHKHAKQKVVEEKLKLVKDVIALNEKVQVQSRLGKL